MIPTIKPAQLESRDGLRKIFIDGAPTNAIKTGLVLGHCEMLGAFDCIPPSGKPGWICRCWTRTNTTNRYLAIVVDNEAASHRVVEIPEVPWADWALAPPAGRYAPETLDWSLAWGDYPEKNARKNYEALRARLSPAAGKACDGMAGTRATRERSEKQGLLARIWSGILWWLE